MKNVIGSFLLLFLFIPISYAETLDDISDAWNKRAVTPEGLENAKLVAKLGEFLANSEKDKNPEVAANAYLFSCKANYFLGDYLPVPRSEKKQVYEVGYLSCKKGIALLELSLGKPKKEEWKNLLADLYFMYTGNFGRWFEDEGRSDAFRYWKDEVQPMLELLAGEMKREHIFGFGPARALGRAWFSIPGGRTKAIHYLKDAFEKSLHTTLNVSIYPLNTAYYVEALIAKGEKAEAKRILEATLEVAQDQNKMNQLEQDSFKEFNEHRMVEMVEEIELCREIYNGMN
jgi:hypothetical protein